MAEGRLWRYYDDIARLADELTAVGRDAEAAALRDAVASGSTSGEILSNTGVVLRTLPQSDGSDLARSVRRLSAECQALWDGAP